MYTKDGSVDNLDCQCSKQVTLLRTAARLRWSKTVQQAFHTDGLPYFCMHSSSDQQVEVSGRLTIEAIDLSDLSRLVIPSQQRYSIRVSAG